jgi:hypothetical protein
MVDDGVFYPRITQIMQILFQQPVENQLTDRLCKNSSTPPIP